MGDLPGILVVYRRELLAGLRGTFALASIIWSVGLLVGGLIGVIASRSRVLGGTMRALAFTATGIPILVLLFWLHYPLQYELGVVIDPFYTAATAIAAVNVIAVADIVRGALRSFPRQFIEAGRVCGMQRGEILRYIQIPIVMRDILPPLLNLQVVMLQSTLFASLIGVTEVFRAAQRVNALVQRPVIVYSSLAIFILAVSLPINGLAWHLARRYGRDYSDR